MEKGFFTSLGRSWSQQGRTHVKTSADAAHSACYPAGFGSLTGAPGLYGVDGRGPRSHSLWPPSVSSSPAISISGLVSGLGAFTCIWAGLCLLDRAGRKSEA